MNHEEALSLFELASEKIDHLIAQNTEIAHGEIYATRDNTIEVLFESGFIKHARRKQLIGMGLHLFDAEGREGMTFSYNFDDTSLEQILENGLKMMRAATPRPDFKDLAFPLSSYAHIEGVYDPTLEDLPLESISEGLQPFFALKDREFTPIGLSGAIEPSVDSVYIWNTNGINLSEIGSSVSAYVSVTLNDAGQNASGSYSQSRVRWDELNIPLIADKGYDTAVRGLKKVTVETGEYPILFSPPAVIDVFLRSISEGVDSENIQNNMSFLNGKMDQQIGAESFSIEDNPLLEGRLGSGGFDAEGTATQPLPVIQNGVLKNYYYNTVTAAKEGIESNGHGTRHSFISSLGISSHNLVVSPGSDNWQDLLHGIQEGIYFDSTGDSPNMITGDFSGLIMTGYLIKDGELGPSLQETMLGINLFDLFQRIESISAEREWHGECYAPWIKITKGTISSRD